MIEVLKRKSTVKYASGSVAIMLVVAALALLFVVTPPSSIVSASSKADYAYCKSITIESDYISSTLHDFPLYVTDTTGDLLGDVQSDGSDITFFSGTTELYSELIDYDSVTGYCKFYVNVTTISSSSDTTIYMYYGNLTGDFPLGYNPSQVWDSHFTAVWHLENLTDSQNYASGNTLTNSGATSGQGGKIGYSYDFTGTSNNYMSTATLWDSGLSDYTVTVWFERDLESSNNCIFNKNQNAYNRVRAWAIASTEPGEPRALVLNNLKEDSGVYMKITTASVSTSAWNFGGFSVTDGGVGKIQLGETHNQTGTVDVMIAGSTYDFALGAILDGGSPEYGYDGRIDEVMISDVARNDSWMNATYHTQNQTSGFLTLGSESTAETDDSSYTVNGLYGANKQWTFTVNAGNAVWSNATGGKGGTAEINISTNASDNCTEVRIYGDDLDPTITANNMYVYVSKDNSTFGLLNHNAGAGTGRFPSGGGNLSINVTTWPGACGACPLPINDPSGWQNFSIYVRIRLTCPGGVGTGTYTTNDGKVYFKVLRS